MNKKPSGWLPVFLALALSGCSAPATREPQNLYLLKQAINAYVDRGLYDEGIARVAATANAWLEQRTPRGGGKLAAVFDIDETLLSNLPHMRAQDFGYVPPRWDGWVAEGTAPGIGPVVRVFRTARRLGVTVFVMSGRRDRDRAGTEKNLRAAGVGDYAALYTKPDGSKDTTESFKTALRKKITEDGYTIVLNIGDQWSDLNGGYAERTFKLPNPFYITK